MDELEHQVDKILSPEKAVRWLTRFIVLIVIVCSSIAIVKVTFHMTDKIETVATTDHNWFVSQIQAVEASNVILRSAEEALDRHQKEVDKRSGLFSFSRSSDRAEFARLNQAIFEAQAHQGSLIEDYNNRASQVTDEVIGDLPRRLHFYQLNWSQGLPS